MYFYILISFFLRIFNYIFEVGFTIEPKLNLKISDNLLIQIISTFVNIALVIVTMNMARESKKVARDNVKVESYPLVSVYKFVENDGIEWGSHLFDEKINRENFNFNIPHKRLVFFMRNIKGNIIIKKIKIVDFEVYDTNETKEIIKFFHTAGKNNDVEGFENVEYLSYLEKERDSDSYYRVPIIFYTSDNELSKILSEGSYRVKMRIEVINHMNVKTSFRVTFNFKKDVKDNDWKIIDHNYFNDIDIKY